MKLKNQDKVGMLETEKMDEFNALSDFDRGQIVMARRLGQSISKTADLVGCPRSAVVSTYQKCSQEGQPAKRRKGHERPRLTDSHREQRIARVARSHRKAIVAQSAKS